MLEGRWQKAVLAASFAAVLATGIVIGAFTTAPAGGAPKPKSGVAGFDSVVFLSHLNSPKLTPGFPGDPVFETSVPFTVPVDGFYLQYVKEGEHTGTHWGAPCHFHVHALCAGQLDAQDLILPAVVIDVRAQVAANVDYKITPADLRAWVDRYGAMPAGAAVIAWTGCSRFWANGHVHGEPNYYNCGTGKAGFHQPGFSLRSVKWLIQHGVLGLRGALGTDTFGPDPGTDFHFHESSLVFHRHRIDLENLTNLESLPPTGAWIVVGGPRNANGSGSPATIYGLVP